MKKLSFVLFIVIAVLACKQGQTQDDFYGTWVYSSGVGIGEGTMEYTITGTIFVSKWTPDWVTSISPINEQLLRFFHGKK